MTRPTRDCSHPRPRTARGVGLVELLIGLTLGLLVIGVAVGAFSGLKRSATNQRGTASVADVAQAAGAYLGKQLVQAGYIDLMANASNRDQIALLDGFGAAPGVGSADMLSSAFAVSHPGLFSLHGCSGPYSNVDSLLNYTCNATMNPLANSVSVAYQVLASTSGWQAPSLRTAFDLAQGYQSDCGALSPRTADNSLASPAGDVVINRFYLDTATRQLMCVGNGNPAKPVRVAGNIEQFQVLYGLPQPAAGGAESVARFVTADAVDTLGAAAWSSVLSVQICILARGEPGSGDVSSSATNVFSLDCLGDPVAANDGAVRRAHRFVVTVRNSVRSAVALP